MQTLKNLFVPAIAFFIALTFIVNFGPQSQGDCSGNPLEVQDGYAAKVGSYTITSGEFRAAYTLRGFAQKDNTEAEALHAKELTLDGLIERELLARAAESVGFTANQNEVVKRLYEKAEFRSTAPVRAPFNFMGSMASGYGYNMAFASFLKDEEKKVVTTENVEEFIKNSLGRTVDEFWTGQMREELAEKMRQRVFASVTVSPKEVEDAWIHDHDTAQLKFVRYQPSFFRDRVTATGADFDAWIVSHTKEIDADYDLKKHQFSGGPFTRARQIFFRVDEHASEEDKKTAREKADKALARVKAGEAFAKVARELSEDYTASDGGELGYVAKGKQPYDEALFALAVGSTSPQVVTTVSGFHILQAVERVEGDVSPEKAKRFLAESLYIEAKIPEVLKAEAERAQAYLASGKSWDELDAQLYCKWVDACAVKRIAEVKAAAAKTDGAEVVKDERSKDAPKVEETSTFRRSDTPIRGPFDASGVLKVAFDELSMAAPLPKAPLQLGSEYVVVGLTGREVADVKNLTTEDRERIHGNFIEQKKRESISLYVARLRDEAEKEGQITVNSKILQYKSSENE